MLDIKKAVRVALESDKARIALCSSASVAALYALTSASPVMAAAAAANAGDDLEEIVVSGYRKSLQSAQDIKRDSDVVVDSVTAADIGELPDRSVTETLQRIPGVQINRFAAGVDPDHFSVEGSGVTVRGLSYVHSEFNERDTFTANNGRALSFADVPAELLGGVDVYKSPSADRIEGGIGGTVNLRTRKPFDSKGMALAGSLEGNYGNFIKKWTPAGSILFSDRWETGIGEIGVLGSYSNSRLKSRADKIMLSNFAIRGLRPDNATLDPSVSGVVPVGDTRVYFPRGAVGGSQEFDRKRQGISAAVQWRSPDESWEAIVQFIRSDARESWSEHTTEIATDNVASNGDSRAEPGTTINVDPSGLFHDGYISGTTGWRADQGLTWGGANLARTPENGLQSNNIFRGVEQKYVTDDISAHVKWTPSAAAQIDFDLQRTKSSVDNLDAGLWTSSYQDAFIQLNGSDLPTVRFIPPVCNVAAAAAAGDGNLTCAGALGTRGNPSYLSAPHTSYADPYNSFYRSAMDHIEKSDGTQKAFRVDGTFSIDDNNWFKSWKVGVRYADRDQTARFSTYNWGVLSEQWGNNGPVWLDTPIATNNNQPLSQYTSYNFPSFFRGKIASPFGTDGRLYYSGNPAKDYNGYVAYANAIQRTWQPTTDPRNLGWNSLYNRAGVIPGTPFLPGEVNPQVEKNTAAYAMLNLAHKLDNGWKLTGNAGVRITKTTRTAEGGEQFPIPGTAFQTDQQCADALTSAMNPVTPLTQQPFCKLSPADRQALRDYQNGAFNPTTVKTSFTYLLPSLNLKLDVGGGWQFRADYFKGVAPPDFGLTRNYSNVSVSAQEFNPKTVNAYVQGSFNVGNPRLRPTESDNVDLSAEWYFSDVGSLTAAFFWKQLSRVTINDTARVNLTNNGVTASSVITTPNNSSHDGNVDGVELAYQQTFDFLPGFWSGFGINANYTYLESSGVPQSTLSGTDPDVAAGRVTTVDISRLPLTGLSKNSYNISPFYQKGPFEVRLAYSWRSKFLLTVRDVIVPFQPIINEGTGQLDGSIFYSFWSSHIKVGLQVSNILNEVERTSAVVDPDTLKTAPRGWYINDTRYTAGVRWTF